MAIKRREIYSNTSPGQSVLTNVEEIDDASREIRLFDAAMNLLSTRPLEHQERESINDIRHRSQLNADWIQTQRDAQALPNSGAATVLRGIIKRLSATDPFGAQLRADRVQGVVGGTVSMEVRLNATPITGLAGFTMRARIRNPAIAKFTDVTFPASFVLASHLPDPVNGPALTGISGVDLGNVIGAEETNILLATLEIEFLSIGVSEVDIDVVAMDDDRGDDIARSVEDTRIRVN